MGYVKEPYGIDLTVDPTPPSVEDRKIISDIIAYYKATGRKKLSGKTVKRRSGGKKSVSA